MRFQLIIFILQLIKSIKTEYKLNTEIGSLFFSFISHVCKLLKVIIKKV